MTQTTAAPPPRIVEDHYANLLAPVYLWMAGGLDQALQQGEADLAAVIGGGTLAVDLGAGFGMHSIVLARAGWDVVAIDQSALLLAQLAQAAAGLSIRPVCSDLRDFASHLHGRRPDLVLCMGDTLAHLHAESDVETLLTSAARALAAGGRLLVSYREHVDPPVGTARFIHVRGDADRVLTCFLEWTGERTIVHDLLHERTAEGWSLRASAYPKLPLRTASIIGILERAGLAVTREATRRGLTFLLARKA